MRHYAGIKPAATILGFIFLMVFILSIAAITAFVMTYFLTRIVIRLAERFSIFDMPGSRKIHTKPVLTTGGLSFIATFYLMIGGGFIFYPTLASQILYHNLTALLVSQALIIGMGIYDDIKGLNASAKFLIQITCSLILIYILGFSINVLTNPFGGEISLGVFSVPLTILWLVGITNAINLIDGLDGLAAGIVLISSFFLSLASLYQGQEGTAVLFIILAASLLSFLKFNFYPARLFMGDTGSLFLGFTVATLSLLISRKTTVSLALFIPIISLGIPILDTSISFIRRLSEKHNPFSGDRKHIHHILLRSGMSHLQIVVFLLLITLLFNVISLAFMVMPGKYFLLILLIVTIIVVISILSLRFLEREVMPH
ncbi:MAG: undecaprenyl/decaprenyl-phosphate alpha-N-acetylglucosaminyl 1-phosphate transferase [Nitrospinae bacterium]|nr:undecaprenyl/decaprenyl-phosphate alpha-N-acetylglucosaminyl 1-phosphate transferase [Nitrospinota bacterium]